MSHRDEIENLMGRYTHAYDFDRLDEMKAFFTEDATMTLQIGDGDPVGPFRGSDAIIQMMRDAHAGQDDRRRHVMSNLVLDDVTDTTARAVSYLTLLAVQDGQVRLLSTATYEDELVRRDGRWLFTRRHIELDMPY
jgi:hypothetical protein